MNKKTVLSSILIFVLGISLGIYVVYALPGSTFYISAGKYPHATSFTFWRENDVYYCKNEYGQLPSYSGSTNGTYVVQNALSDGTGSKALYFTKGIFVLDNVAIPVNTNIKVTGEGWATIITRSGNNSIFRFEGTSLSIRVRGIIFRDLHFKSGEYTGELFYFNHAHILRFEDCLFIHEKWGAYAIYAEDTWDTMFYGCRFHGGGDDTHAVVMLKNGDTNNCNNWRFINCRWERRFENNIEWNTIALHSDSWGSGSDNHNIHIGYSKIHGEPNASFTVGAVEFYGTSYSSITNSWICHHKGTIIDTKSSFQCYYSNLNFYNTATQGNFTTAISINGTNNRVDNLTFEGTGATGELVLLGSTSAYNFVDAGTIISSFSGVTKVTDDGTGNSVRS